MLRYYGIDLLDYYRGRLTARRLRVLIRHLPRESALVRAVHGPVADWGPVEHLLASTVDELAAANWLFVSANLPEHADAPPRPEPVHRPGVEPAEPETATPEQIATFFSGR